MSLESFFGSEIHRCAHVKASTRDAEGWNQEIRIQPEQALISGPASQIRGCRSLYRPHDLCEPVVDKMPRHSLTARK